jgi:signal peptidase I
MLGCLFELAEALALGLAVLLALQLFVFEPHRVPQSYMQDTLASGQYILVDKISPMVDTYHRGDVVALNPPSNWGSKEATVMRVIAVANDTIDIHDGSAFVNGTKLDEWYVQKGDLTAPVDLAHHVWTIPSGQLFVMGDDRSGSQDSRTYGPIDKSVVIGRVLLRFWPLSGFGLIPPARLPAVPAPGATPTPCPACK